MQKQSTSKVHDKNETQSNGIFKDIPIVALVSVLVLFAFKLMKHRLIFPDNWFPSHFAASAFMILFCLWIFSEIVNSLWSRKNSQTTSKDKDSYRFIVIASWAAIFITFMLRSKFIGIFSGSLQYAGLVLIFFGIVLRECSIWILGRHFTVRVQVRENAKLITQGPYKYIRHPSYTGGILTFAGIPIAIGTWLGALIVLIIKLIVIQYRIHVEEKALQAAFGSEYEEYKKKTWKLFPGF